MNAVLIAALTIGGTMYQWDGRLDRNAGGYNFVLTINTSGLTRVDIDTDDPEINQTYQGVFGFDFAFGEVSWDVSSDPVYVQLYSNPGQDLAGKMLEEVDWVAGSINLNTTGEYGWANGNLFLDSFKRYPSGDANLDEEFLSNDLVYVFQGGKYETGDIAAWEEGDWNYDLQFSSSDMVDAFQANEYEMKNPPWLKSVPVPEPNMSLVYVLCFFLLRRRA